MQVRNLNELFSLSKQFLLLANYKGPYHAVAYQESLFWKAMKTRTSPGPVVVVKWTSNSPWTPLSELNLIYFIKGSNL